MISTIVRNKHGLIIVLRGAFVPDCPLAKVIGHGIWCPEHDASRMTGGQRVSSAEAFGFYGLPSNESFLGSEPGDLPPSQYPL